MSTKCFFITLSLFLSLVSSNVSAQESITLNENEMIVYLNGTKTLVATVSAGEAIQSWQSSNPSVATVDQSGKVAAVSLGTTNITVQGLLKSAVCQVTVKEIPSVSLNKTSLVLKVGESETLVATAVNEAIQYWMTSDPSVAIVDNNGKVTAIATGSASITAWGVQRWKSCQVTVTTGSPSVTLNKTSLVLKVGDSETLVATAVNEEIQYWMTSDPSVATVDNNGKVTAIATGSASITAWGVQRWKSCQVTVTTGALQVNGVSLNKLSLTLTEGATETLVASISPASAVNNSVTWSSNNPSVASVDANGNVTAHTSGTATIKVITSNGLFSATCTVNVVKGNVSLSVSSSPAEGGEVSSSGNYAPGSNVTVKAIPNENYIFKQWEIGGVAVSTEATYTFSIASDVKLVAVFEKGNDTSTDQVSGGINLSAYEGTLYIQSDKNLESVTIHTINGQCLYRNSSNARALNITELPKGLLIVTIGTQARKVMMR